LFDNDANIEVLVVVIDIEPVIDVEAAAVVNSIGFE
jgi:hypothetical protein